MWITPTNPPLWGVFGGYPPASCSHPPQVGGAFSSHSFHSKGLLCTLILPHPTTSILGFITCFLWRTALIMSVRVCFHTKDLAQLRMLIADRYCTASLWQLWIQLDDCPCLIYIWMSVQLSFTRIQNWCFTCTFDSFLNIDCRYLHVTFYLVLQDFVRILELYSIVLLL